MEENSGADLAAWNKINYKCLPRIILHVSESCIPNASYPHLEQMLNIQWNILPQRWYYNDNINTNNDNDNNYNDNNNDSNNDNNNNKTITIIIEYNNYYYYYYYYYYSFSYSSHNALPGLSE